MRKLLSLIVVLIMWLNGMAAHYFVSNSGSDANNGTSTSTPFLTLSKANSVSVAGDIISLNGGNIFAGVTITKSGASGNPILYNSYGTGQAIVSGLTTATGFTNISGSIWESAAFASGLATCNILVINGISVANGRFPNTGYLTYQTSSTTTLTSSSLNSSVTNWTGAQAVIRKQPWIIDKSTITSQSGSTITYPSVSSYAGQANWGFFIQNDLRTLDVQNEWYYNPTTKKIDIFSSSSPTNIQIPTITDLVTINTHDWITFDNIDFEGANNFIFNLTTTNHITVVNCKIQYAGVDGIHGNNSGASTGCVFNNNTISNCNNNSFFLNSVFTTALISNNVISNNGIIVGASLSGDGNCYTIRTEAASDTIRNNTLHANGYIGIGFDGANVTVKNNYIDSVDLIKDDGAGIYTSQNPTGKVILNNIVTNSIGNFAGTTFTYSQANGIYLDNTGTQQTNGIIVDGNSVLNIGQHGYFLHNVLNTVLTNNTAYNCGSGISTGCLAIVNDVAGFTISGLVVNHNIFVSKISGQHVARFFTIHNDIPSFGVFNFNSYACPINDNLTFDILPNGNAAGSETLKSLAQWKTYSSQDAASTKSPLAITNVAQLFTYYSTALTDSAISVVSGVNMLNASFGGSTTFHPFTSLILISTGALITPTISWTPASPITYGTALGAAQLNATSGGVPGTFTYNPVAGTILNAGTQTLSVHFAPSDPSTYASVDKTVTIQVNAAPATISYSNLSQGYTGSPLAPTITTNPVGVATFSTYNGVGAIPINAGTYNVLTGVTDVNYTATPQSATFVITAAPATINVSNTSQIYDGTSKSVTVITSPAGLSNSVTYNGSPTLPVNAGSYTVVVTLTDGNHTATPITTTLAIAKATPTVSWTPSTPITYPTALGGSQLNASASVAGTFTYTPASGTILNAGTQILSVNFTPSDAANYNSVNNTTRSITVNKGTATISISNLAQTWDGTQKTVTVVTSPAGLGVLTITYNGSTTPPTGAGSYPINVTLNNSNYNATPATGTLVISKADATISLNNLTQIYNGSQRVVTATTVPAGLSVSITYNGSGIAPTNAGSYPIVATISDPNLQGSTTGTLVVNKATPVISWGNPVSIVYGTPLTGTQLNASSSVAGTFVYTPPSGTILNVGTNNLVADFTPTDASNYNSVNGTTVSITVTKATATITVSNLNQFADGSTKPVTVSVSPNVGVIAVLYNGSPTAPSAAGSYPVSVTLTNSNYTAVPFSGTLVISNSSASVTITNTDQVYDGSPKPVTVTTIPAGLPVIITYDDAATVPANAGSYSVTATINDGGIHTGSASATLTINKANPVVSWGNPTFISYGIPLSGTQLNASANVAGTFIYTPAAGTILNAGTQPLSVNFTPTDIANYNTVSGVTVNITVIKATATISLSNLNQIFDGSQKVATVTTSPVGLAAISVTYNGSNTPPSAVGSYAVVASLNNSNYIATPANNTLVISATTAGIFISNLAQVYTGGQLPVTVTTNPVGLSNTVTYNGSATIPTVSGTYTVIATLNDGTHTGADTETYVISKAQSIITWPNPAAITFGTALSSSQLNATANTSGAFTYSPLAGTILNAGTQNISVTFTPTDNNFLPSTKTVTIVVNQATAILTLSNVIQTYNGTPRPVIVTTSPAGLSGVTILYNGSLTPPTNAGIYPVTVTLVNSNYTSTPLAGTLTINKATPTLNWNIPQPVEELTKLSALQLNATSTTAGTFVYSPVAGTTLIAGTYILSATFTPTDTVNYNSGSITVSLNVYGSPVKSIWIKHGSEKYMDAPIQ